MRQQKSRSLADTFEAWLRAKQALIRQKNKLADAIRYALSRWQGLTRFTTTAASNSTTTRSNDQSVASSSIARTRSLPGPTAGLDTGRSSPPCPRPCKLNDVDPLAYLTDVLTRIVNGIRTAT